MKFPSESPVTKAKLASLKARIECLEIDLGKVDERAIKATGPGGQKVNKTSSGVQLLYEPLGIVVKWSRERSRHLNRFLALRELVDEIEVRVSPETSKRLREHERLRKQKQRRKRRRRPTSPLLKVEPAETLTPDSSNYLSNQEERARNIRLEARVDGLKTVLCCGACMRHAWCMHSCMIR